MMLDRVLAIGALVALVAFVGTVALYVGITDLIVIGALVLAMAIYDFWHALRPRAPD